MIWISAAILSAAFAGLTSILKKAFAGLCLMVAGTLLMVFFK